MIGAKCGFCESTIGTKIVTIEPTQSQFKMNAICCKSCNAILSVTNFFDTSAQLKKIGEKLGIRF